MVTSIDSWKEVTNTEAVNPSSFLHYQHMQEGEVTRVALNLISSLPASSPIAPRKKEGEKKFYFCVGCKNSTIASKIFHLFQKQHPSLQITTGPIGYEGEEGVLIWITFHQEAIQHFKPIIATACDVKLLGQDALPQDIANRFIKKVESATGASSISSQNDSLEHSKSSNVN